MPNKMSAALAGALALAGATAPADAQTPEAFYAGKTLSLIVGYTVGGGYDIYGRALARHIGRHIPGSPTIVTQNMPGAGSQKSLEYLLTVAPKDGLTLGTFSRTLAIAPLIEGARYDPTRLEWVGSISTDASTCVAWHASPVKSWDDLKSKPFTVGGLGKASDPDMYATILRLMFGLNVKLVSGYPGTNEVALAMERGEVDGICGYSYSSLRASRKNWLDDNKATILLQAALKPDSALPEVPMLLDKTTSSEQRDALSLILAPQAVARPFAMPPGTPADRVSAVRAAFMATMTDPEFVKEAKAAGLDIDPMPGQDIADLYRKVYATPASVVADARRAAGN